MTFFRQSTLILTAAFSLLACTPAFETTAQLCQTFLPATIPVEGYRVSSNSDTNDYKLYLEDILNSLQNTQSKTVNDDGTTTLNTLSADELAVVDFIFSKSSSLMGYTLQDGVVNSANNPLDYLESVIAATDEDEIIETFVEAKSQLAMAISENNDFCNYQNNAITVIQEDSDLNILSQVSAQFDLTFNPFNTGEDSIVDQILILTQSILDPENPDDTTTLNQLSFSGIDRIHSDNFKSSGFSSANVRQLSVTQSNTNETFFADDDFDTSKHGVVVFTNLNAFCKDEDGLNTQCPEGTLTKAVAHQDCEGGEDADGNELLDETNQVAINSFDIVEGNPDLSGLQRFKAEIDYPNNEIRLFFSKYSDAIVKGDASIDQKNPAPEDILYNPTNCERLAVSKQLFENLTSEEQEDYPDGISVTEIDDPGYDKMYILDEDGNRVTDSETGEDAFTEPTPFLILQGTAIPERQ